MLRKIKDFRISVRTANIIIGVAMLITLIAWIAGGIWIMTR